MKITSAFFSVALMFAALPAFAQHGGHGGEGQDLGGVVMPDGSAMPPRSSNSCVESDQSVCSIVYQAGFPNIGDTCRLMVDQYTFNSGGLGVCRTVAQAGFLDMAVNRCMIAIRGRILRASHVNQCQILASRGSLDAATTCLEKAN